MAGAEELNSPWSRIRIPYRVRQINFGFRISRVSSISHRFSNRFPDSQF